MHSNEINNNGNKISVAGKSGWEELDTKVLRMYYLKCPGFNNKTTKNYETCKKKV